MGKNKVQESPTQALVKQVFRKNLSEAKNAQKDKNYDIQLAFDMVEPYYSRRQKAVIRMMPEVLSRYKDKYSEESIIKSFAKISSLPAISYEDLEVHSYILLGATIWILDKLRQHDLLHNASQILPPAAQTLNMPKMYDSVHSFDLIASMLTVLQERYGKNDHVIAPKSSSRREDDIFHQILDMIPQEDKDFTVSQFKSAFWDWAALYFEDVKAFIDENEKLDKVFEEYERQADEIMRKQPQSERNQKTVPFTPLNMSTLSPQNFSTLPTRLRVLENSTHIDHFSRMDALIAKMQNTDKALDALSERYSDFLFFNCRCSMVGRGTLKSAIGKEAADRYYNFPIEDPYAICFALIFLFDLDDDYVWTYGFATGIVCRAATMLPWGYNDYSDKADELLHDPDTGCYIPAGTLSEPLYSMDYKGKTMFEEDGVPSANLAQIIYEYSGGILPRNMERYDGLQKELRKKGLKPSQVSTACALMAVLAESSCQCEFSLINHSTGDSNMPVVHEEPEVNADAALIAENERLRRELAKLRESSKREIYTANKAAEDLKERLDRANDIIEENSQELADLRGIVFNFQLDSGTSESPTKMTFPQHTSRRIVAFGGHDSGLREIKPKLPDVRFYGENVTSPDIIRKADVVWIQTNCIGHRSYYHIIDLCRKHNRRVRYFGYASTAKCAEQVIEEETNYRNIG